MMDYRIILLAVAVVSCSAPSLAASNTIYGWVLGTNGEYLRGATIELTLTQALQENIRRGREAERQIFYAKTNTTGHYRQKHLPSGVYTVVLRVNGVEADRASNVTLSARSEISVDFDLYTKQTNGVFFHTPVEEHNYQKTIAQEEAAREQEADAARKETADKFFREGIIKAWHAADEREPFASIRGNFDLTSPNSREYKTSLQLPQTERCILIKTPAAPNSVPLWTFVCQFSFPSRFYGSYDSYQRIVQAVQSTLNIAYRPDEAAVNVNQVFFADPSKPLWKLVLRQISFSGSYRRLFRALDLLNRQ